MSRTYKDNTKKNKYKRNQSTQPPTKSPKTPINTGSNYTPPDTTDTEVSGNVTNYTGSSWGKYTRPVYQEFVEVYPNLWLGSKYRLMELLIGSGEMGDGVDERTLGVDERTLGVDERTLGVDIDVLVCLDGMSEGVGDVYGRAGYKGLIEYVPIQDFDKLPKWKLEEIATKIANWVNDGKKVALFCAGGKGRTGYVASKALRKLDGGYHERGVVGYLREFYNKGAVETVEQLKDVVEPEHQEYWIEQLEDDLYGWGDMETMSMSEYYEAIIKGDIKF